MQSYIYALGKVMESPSRYFAYQKMLFDGVSLAGRKFLDVGGGNGVMSHYAISQGASSATCIDPLGSGSDESADQQYQVFSQYFGGRVSRIHESFQEWEADDLYDVVLLHNSVNHLDEDACARIPASDARHIYLDIFAKLRSLLLTGGHLIIIDCSRRNLWGDFRLHNIFNPSIEWHIHQQPRLWDELLTEVGFRPGRIRWNAPRRMGKFGQLIFGNLVGAYLTSSHFVLTTQA